MIATFQWMIEWFVYWQAIFARKFESFVHSEMEMIACFELEAAATLSAIIEL